MKYLSLSMLKDLLPFAIILVTITLSWASNQATSDKNTALMNQKLDTVISNQEKVDQQLGMLAQELVAIKLGQGMHEVRITTLETLAASLLSKAN